jgi:hypothetical protein
MNKFCLAMLVALVVPSVASAGGGNTKATSTLRFSNTVATDTVYVIVADAATLATTTQANFVARGGKAINGVSTVSFPNLKAGVQTYAFARVALNAPIPAPAAFTAAARSINAGQTITIVIPAP